MIYSITAIFKRVLPVLVLAVCFLYVKRVVAQEESEYFFPQEEYDHYMRLMAEVDPHVYDQLNMCYKEFGSPCVEKDEQSSRIEPATEDTLGYPIIYLYSMLDKSEQEQREILASYAQQYRLLDRHITPDERLYMLAIIRSIDQILYDMITEVDPTGVRHILWSDEIGLSSSFSETDGLPVIFIDRYTLSLLTPYEQRAFIAHELGHYVLKHLQGNQAPSHSYLFERNLHDQIFTRGKKVSGQLIPYQTFKLAAERIQEHEADRSAIFDFGVDIDVMISAARKIRDGTEVFEHIQPYKETFKRTHPLWADRIKHLESLRSEIELKIAKKQPLVRFDWKSLAKEYEQHITF